MWKKNSFYYRFLLILAAMMISNSGFHGNRVWAKDKIQIAVSIPPQAWLVEQITGDLAEVTWMIPTGSSPATYEPSPRQLVALSQARVYVKVGHPDFVFERKHINPLLKDRPELKVIGMSSELDLLNLPVHDPGHGTPEQGDPHIWVAPANMYRTAQHLCESLAALYPDHEEVFRRNLARLLRQIDELDQRIHQRLDPLKNRRFMVYHPSWGYFARQYNLEQVAIENEGKKPGSSGIIRLIKQARAENIRVIFVQKGFNQESARIIADEINGTVVEVDPLAYDWLTNMDEISRAFQRALQ